MAASVGAYGLALLWPARCPGCDRATPPGAGLAARVPDGTGPEGAFCALCRIALEPAGELCLPGLDATWAAFRYGGSIRDAILRLKHGGRRDLAAPLGMALLPAWSALARCAGASAIVAAPPVTDAAGAAAPVLWLPVPLHPARLRQRGFNQSLELLRALRRQVSQGRSPLAAPHVRLLPDALVRVRDTPPLGRLPPAARRELVAGVFRVRDPARIAGRAVLLADDVVTTGATLGECAGVLRAAGAARVVAVALAHAA